MNQDLRFYTSYAALLGFATYGAGLLFESSNSSSMFPVLGGIYGISKAVAFKGISLIPLKENEGKLSLLAKYISSYLFASTCTFFISHAIKAPLTFKASLIAGLAFEYFGGSFLAIACIVFAIGVVILHKLQIIHGTSLRDDLNKWTKDKGRNTIICYLYMNEIISQSVN